MKLFSRLFIISAILCGVLFLNGCISPRRKCMAAAEDGDAKSQGLLGSTYLTGNGSAINYSNAYYWLRLGAANGDSLAAYYLGVIYQNGFGKVIPDQIRAARHYKGVYKDIHTKAKQGDLAYLNILAEMYYYGRGLEQNKTEAIKMFEYCVKRRWQPAIENLGVILFTNDKFKDVKRAKSLLFEAAAYNYPRAQFYLAEYYSRYGDNNTAIAQLKKSSAGGFPPAMFKLAEEYSKINSPQADILFKVAANEGYAPAMLIVADGICGTEQKLKWIKNAVEHSSVPAMLQYAKLISERVNPDPAKEMILYLLALKIRKDNPQIKKSILDLDKQTGLFFPVKYTWENISGGENILLANSEIERVLKGFKAGIVAGSKKLFKERLAYNPLPFFMNNDWYLLHENSLPPIWSAQLFKAVERHGGHNPGFWISYGISAGLAGQGIAQAFAAFKLNELLKKRGKKLENNSLMNITALMKANALILLNYDTEAYTSLFQNGNLMRDDLPFLINFINFWCRPLLKDKHKFCIATGIDPKKLSEFSLPEKKDFFNLEYGHVISTKAKVNEPQINFGYLKKNK